MDKSLNCRAWFMWKEFDSCLCSCRCHTPSCCHYSLAMLSRRHGVIVISCRSASSGKLEAFEACDAHRLFWRSACALPEVLILNKRRRENRGGRSRQRGGGGDADTPPRRGSVHCEGACQTSQHMKPRPRPMSSCCSQLALFHGRGAPPGLLPPRGVCMCVCVCLYEYNHV